jgi:hypothetical protein
MKLFILILFIFIVYCDCDIIDNIKEVLASDNTKNNKKDRNNNDNISDSIKDLLVSNSMDIKNLNLLDNIMNNPQKQTDINSK